MYEVQKCQTCRGEGTAFLEWNREFKPHRESLLNPSTRAILPAGKRMFAFHFELGPIAILPIDKRCYWVCEKPSSIGDRNETCAKDRSLYFPVSCAGCGAIARARPSNDSRCYASRFRGEPCRRVLQHVHSVVAARGAPRHRCKQSFLVSLPLGRDNRANLCLDWKCLADKTSW